MLGFAPAPIFLQSHILCTLYKSPSKSFERGSPPPPPSCPSSLYTHAKRPHTHVKDPAVNVRFPQIGERQINVSQNVSAVSAQERRTALYIKRCKYVSKTILLQNVKRGPGSSAFVDIRHPSSTNLVDAPPWLAAWTCRSERN